MEIPVLVRSGALEERKRCAEVGVVAVSESESEADEKGADVQEVVARPPSKDDVLLPPLPPAPEELLHVSEQLEDRELLLRTPGSPREVNNVQLQSHGLGLGLPLAFAPPPEITLEDMSLALDARDYMDSPSATTFNSRIFDTMSSNASINVLDASSMVSASPKVAPQHCIVEPVGVPLDPSHLSEPRRRQSRLFPLPGSVSPTPALPAGGSNTTTVPGRSRSLSNSNILRKLSLGSLGSLGGSRSASRSGSVGSDMATIPAGNRIPSSPALTSTPIAEEESHVRSTREYVRPNTSTTTTNTNTPRRRRRAATLIVASVTPEDELRRWPAMDFRSDEEQGAYVRALVHQQTRDDLSFDVALRRLAQDAWQSQTEVAALQQQRIRMNGLWARKITHYQG